jgi:hypothetical protein
VDAGASDGELEKRNFSSFSVFRLCTRCSLSPWALGVLGDGDEIAVFIFILNYCTIIVLFNYIFLLLVYFLQ